VVAVGALVIVGIVAIRGAGDTSFGLDSPIGGKIELSTTKHVVVSEQTADGFDTKEYVISSEYGFAYKNPETGSAWDAVKGYDGMPPAEARYISCLARGMKVPTVVSRVTRQETGSTVRVAIGPKSSFDVYGTKLPSGVTRTCEFAFRNSFTVEVIPKPRLQKLVGTKLSLPAFVSFAISQFGIQLDRLVASTDQILGTWTWRAFGVGVDGIRGDFTEYRAFAFTETKENFFITEIAFSPQSDSAPDRWHELQDMLESFRLIDRET